MEVEKEIFLVFKESNINAVKVVFCDFSIDEKSGVPGFEPGNAGIKTPCLTAWRHPNKDLNEERYIKWNLEKIQASVIFIILSR